MALRRPVPLWGQRADLPRSPHAIRRPPAIRAMLARPASDEYAPYYDTYVSKVPDGDICDLLRLQRVTSEQRCSPAPERCGGPLLQKSTTRHTFHPSPPPSYECAKAG